MFALCGDYKVLSLQICWYGDLNDKTRGRVGRGGGQSPGRPARVGAPVSSCRPAAPSAERAPRPAESRASFALSERALGLGRRQGAVLGSRGLGAEHWRLQWLERLKLQSRARG